MTDGSTGTGLNETMEVVTRNMEASDESRQAIASPVTPHLQQSTACGTGMRDGHAPSANSSDLDLPMLRR
jgi:hypothetical protein